jgi:anti-sigma factor RsiW
MTLRSRIFGMTCRELADFLLAYLDGELNARERSRFDRHLFWCRPCRAYLDSYRTTVQLARSLGKPARDELPEPVPEALVQAVLAVRGESR